MSKKIVAIDDLTPDPRNANTGTERGAYMVEHSLEQYGAGRSILADGQGVVIAGNKTLQAAADLGIPVKVVETDGHELVVVQRTDLDLLSDDGRARLLAYADNRSSEVGLEWDVEQIAIDLGEGLDLSGLFQDFELEEMQKPDDDNTYSRNIKPPEYIPSMVRPPDINVLYDDSKTADLISEINSDDSISDEEKVFLCAAACRHTVLNFENIAEYYSFASPEMQRLMENNALVIIDFNEAIKQGFVELSMKISNMVREEYGDE